MIRTAIRCSRTKSSLSEFASSDSMCQQHEANIRGRGETGYVVFKNLFRSLLYKGVGAFGVTPSPPLSTNLYPS